MLRIQLHDRFWLTTTVGYGLCFLHPTSQLYKGNAGNGIFIQLTPTTHAMGYPRRSRIAGFIYHLRYAQDAPGLDRHALPDAKW